MLRHIIAVLLLFMTQYLYGQQETYFYKIQEISTKTRLDTELHRKLDSLKFTSEPKHSRIRILFNRDVDFGFKHERIQITLNSNDYQINLLSRNDTICFSSVIFCNIFGAPSSTYERYFNEKHSIPKIDTAKAMLFLKSRNRFYNSIKTLSELKKELDINEWYALHMGDGEVESQSKKHIDTLVKQRDFTALEIMLKSINCETQTYAVRGFDLLKRNKVKISRNDLLIVDHIKKRNSDLESTSGDIGPIIWKAYK